EDLLGNLALALFALGFEQLLAIVLERCLRRHVLHPHQPELDFAAVSLRRAAEHARSCVERVTSNHASGMSTVVIAQLPERAAGDVARRQRHRPGEYQATVDDARLGK